MPGFGDQPRERNPRLGPRNGNPVANEPQVPGGGGPVHTTTPNFPGRPVTPTGTPPPIQPPVTIPNIPQMTPAVPSPVVPRPNPGVPPPGTPTGLPGVVTGFDQGPALAGVRSPAFFTNRVVGPGEGSTPRIFGEGAPVTGGANLPFGEEEILQAILARLAGL